MIIERISAVPIQSAKYSGKYTLNLYAIRPLPKLALASIVFVRFPLVFIVVEA